MKIAVITMVFNEPVFLPIWLNYYAAELGYENLYIIDHRSSDCSINSARKRGATNIIKLETDELDEQERVNQISYYHQRLLRRYDAVIYTDVDEIIIPSPLTRLTLKEYIEAKVETYINLLGLNVIHDVHEEPRLDLGQPLFKQRSYAQFDWVYCKPLVSKIPLDWLPGFHDTRQHPRKQVSDLFLFHLRAMDFDIAKTRIHNLNLVKLSKASLENKHSLHFRWTEKEYLDYLFLKPEAKFKNARQDFDFSQVAAAIALPLIKMHKFEGSMYRIPQYFGDALQLVQDEITECSG
jgi:hypothetical protein